MALQNAPTTVFLDLPGCNIMRLMVGAHTHLPPIRRFYSFDGAEVAVSLAMELTEQGLAYHLEAMSEGLYQPDLIDDMLTIVGTLFPDEHVE